MNSLQYREIVKALGLSIVGAGPVLGVGRRQSQRYASGDAIPEPVARLLVMLERHGIPEEWRARP